MKRKEFKNGVETVKTKAPLVSVSADHTLVQNNKSPEP